MASQYEPDDADAVRCHRQLTLMASLIEDAIALRDNALASRVLEHLVGRIDAHCRQFDADGPIGPVSDEMARRRARAFGIAGALTLSVRDGDAALAVRLAPHLQEAVERLVDGERLAAMAMIPAVAGGGAKEHP